MANVGSWDVKVVVNSYPQKVATALGNLKDELLGVVYEPIAYLGSQVVNGTNHAVLAEQTVLTGRDTKNIVVLIFNEKPTDVDSATLVGIDRVVQSGGPLGGTSIDAKTEIPEDAMKVWENAFDGFVGSKVEPFALLGTQLTNGVNYIFAAKMTPVTLEPVSKIVLVTINEAIKGASFVDILVDRQEASFGYAFSW